MNSKVSPQNEKPFPEFDELYCLILSEITDALCRSQPVELRGFGRFSVTIRKSRQGRNPQNGPKVEVPSKKAIKWKCSKSLFAQLNKNFTEDKISVTN